jgi:hypothetical protein
MCLGPATAGFLNYTLLARLIMVEQGAILSIPWSIVMNRANYSKVRTLTI